MADRRRNDTDTDAPVMMDAPERAETSRREAARRQRRGRHTASRRQPERTGLSTVVTFASIAVLAILLLVLVSRLAGWDAFKRMRIADRAPVIADGLTVDGVDVSGFTRAKAEALLNTSNAPETSAFQYRIHVGGQVSVMSEADLPVGSNLDAVLDQAWSLSRRLVLSQGETADSPVAARIRLRDQIRREGAALSSMTGYDVTDITRYVDALAVRVDRQPVDAALISVDFSRRDFMFSDDVSGLTLDCDGLVEEIARRLNAGETDADIEAPVTLVPAVISRLRLKNTFGCLEVRNFDTDTPGGDQAVRAFVSAVNGAIIPGGETVSLRGLLEDTAKYESANADRFATAMFSAGVCAGMTLVERAPQTDTGLKNRGLEACLDAEHDLRLKNTARTPMCVLCYYTPLNGRGTRGSVTMEVYGIMRQGGETAELTAEVTETKSAGTPEYQVNPDLEPGTTLLRREARDGATVNTVLLRKVNGRVYSSDIICTAVYPPVSRLIETGP